MFIPGLASAAGGAASGRQLTTAEEWTKERVCAGQVADLGSLPARGLSAAVLADLLFGRLCALPPRGVHIVNAEFTEPLNLEGTNIAVPFRLRHSRFDAPVSLERVRADKVLSFAGSRFAQSLVMSEIDVRGSLFLGGGATYAAPVILQGAHVGGQAVFSSDSLDVRDVGEAGEAVAPGSAASAEEAPTRFAAPVDMGDIRIAGALDLRGIVAAANVSLDRARIDGDVRLTGGRFCADLNMGTIRIGESLEAWGLTWASPPTCPMAPSGGATASKPSSTSWNLYNSDIRGNLFLSGADLTHLDLFNLSGTRIGGQLFLGSIDHMPTNAWGERSILMLRNVSVGKIQDVGSIYTDRPASAAGSGGEIAASTADPRQRQSWAPFLVLDGFSYGAWDGLGREERSYGDERRIVPARDEEWLIPWLARDRSYTRQPYEQLAGVMEAQGRRESRDAILFTSRDIERCIAAGGQSGHEIEACVLRKSGLDGEPTIVPPPSRTGPGDTLGMLVERARNASVLTATWLVNGYGYRPARALAWFLLLIAVGTFLFRYRTEAGRARSIWFAGEYTINTMLPAVTLRPEFEAINISGGVRYYFVLLKVMGYVFIATLLQVFYQLVGQSGG